MLLAHMYELRTEVDLFVIVESSHTLFGEPRKSALKELIESGDKRLHQFGNFVIVRHNSLLRGDALREERDEWETLSRSVAELIPKSAKIRDRDLVVMAHTESEIPTAEAVRELKTCPGWSGFVRGAFQVRPYSFRFRCPGVWTAPAYAFYRDELKAMPLLSAARPSGSAEFDAKGAPEKHQPRGWYMPWFDIGADLSREFLFSPMRRAFTSTFGTFESLVRLRRARVALVSAWHPVSQLEASDESDSPEAFREGSERADAAGAAGAAGADGAGAGAGAGGPDPAGAAATGAGASH